MIELTSFLPMNRSRTSTQASSVPNTAFTATTSSDTTSVSLSAATASGAETDAQNYPSPGRRLPGERRQRQQDERLR